MNSCFGKDCMALTQPDPNRGILCCIDFGAMDAAKCAEVAIKDQMRENWTHSNEAVDPGRCHEAHLAADETIQRHRPHELPALSVRPQIRKFAKVDGEVSKEFEDCYLQMPSAVFFFDVPGWAMTLWTTFRWIVPRKIEDKVDFAPYDAARTLCQPFLEHVSEADLPKIETRPLPSVSVQLTAATGSQSP